MILWISAISLLLLGILEFLDWIRVRMRTESGRLIHAAENLFFELEETLASGLLPGEERWAKLETLVEPWRSLAVESFRALRSEGGSVIPTLRRFRELARNHLDSLGNARAKSGQALAQAWVCAALIPLWGLALWFLLPEVEGAGGVWWFATLGAALLGCAAAAWIYQMAEKARWGGLKGKDREWMLGSLVFGERILALLRLGRAPDRAWAESMSILPSALQAQWGGDAWKSEASPSREAHSKNLRESLLHGGNAFRKAIQSSLWEGHPCSERIESTIEGMRSEIRAHQERELQLLGTRALKPLFLLTAPGLLGLLGFALLLSFASATEGLG